MMDYRTIHSTQRQTYHIHRAEPHTHYTKQLFPWEGGGGSGGDETAAANRHVNYYASIRFQDRYGKAFSRKTQEATRYLPLKCSILQLTGLAFSSSVCSFLVVGARV